MIVPMDTKIRDLVNDVFRRSFAVMDDAASPSANTILLESVRNDKRTRDAETIHPMRDMPQNRGNGTFLYIDPLLDDERSVNKIMAVLGFSGKLMVFDKSLKRTGNGVIA